MEKKLHPVFGFHASALKILAMTLMLVDHIGAVFFPGIMWLRLIGRLSFPIFAYQIVQGAQHTGNRLRYGQRLLAFALISELPFDLMASGRMWNPAYQNVLFTLLLGFLGVLALERWNSRRECWKALCAAIGCCIAGSLLSVDYGAAGVATVLVFFLFRDGRSRILWQALALAVLYGFCVDSADIPLRVFGLECFVPVQLFAIFALVPIHLFCNPSHFHSRAFRWFGYAFYPAHMLVLSVLSRLL